MYYLIWMLLGAILFSTDAAPVAEHAHYRTKRDALKQMPEDREICKPGATEPVNRVNTTDRLKALRDLFDENGIDGYIVYTADAHQSEYPPEYDRRRQYISGFTGSSGTAVILRNKAALWADGRYYLQAEDELDCNWVLMKSSESTTPYRTTWLLDNLGGTNATVGASPYYVSTSSWLYIDKTLKAGSVNFKQITNDLIDQIWTTGRLTQPNSKINELPLKYAGRSWQNKIEDMHAAMAGKHADALIITGLDETAWLFNLRATDIPYNPFFVSYAIVERRNNRTRLFLREKDRKLIEDSSESASTKKLHQHLNTGTTGSCTGKTGLCVEVVDYDSMLSELHNLNNDDGIKKVWTTNWYNYAIYAALDKKEILQANTPAALIKTRKNSVEQQGMRNSHIRDSVALIKFLAKLEKEVKEGKKVTELSAAEDLKQHRLQAEHNRGLSFPSISGSGPNGAVIHYVPLPATDRDITVNDMYLLDSGGQYLDGTTDVTRTFHFGEPTDYQKDCYTRVLKGHGDLSSLVWRSNLYGRQLDVLTRRPLWEVGLDYRHGTGHGIGAYLSVHEGPGWISLSHYRYDVDEVLDKYQFFSDEPGYYEDGQFGIRLENIVMVTEAQTKHKLGYGPFLTFEAVTLVPYEKNLINYDLLTFEQINWINDYHKKVQDVIGPLIKNDPVASAWLSSRTGYIDIKRYNVNSAVVVHVQFLSVILCVIFSLI